MRIYKLASVCPTSGSSTERNLRAVEVTDAILRTIRSLRRTWASTRVRRRTKMHSI